jgi:hypothetical protein
MKLDDVTRRRSGLRRLVVLASLLLGAVWLLGLPAAGFEVAPGATPVGELPLADPEPSSAVLPVRRRLAAAIRRILIRSGRPPVPAAVTAGLPMVRWRFGDQADDPVEQAGWAAATAKRGPPHAPLLAA